MKIGICGDIIKAQSAIVAGYDYAEFHLTKLTNMPDDEFAALSRERERLGIPVESFNCFCPSEIRLTAGVDRDVLSAHAEKAFSRAERLGGELSVIGSGRSRNIPEGYEISKAREEFMSALTLVESIARRHGIRLALEPLRPAETNFINTMASAAEICDAMGNENIGCVVDLFHLDQNGEDMADVVKYGRHIIHTHLARRNIDRRIPTIEDMDQVGLFFDALSAIGYEGRMSLEGTYYPDFDASIAAAMQLFRGLGVK